MPPEYVTLSKRPSPIDVCPKCGAKPFDPFMRGQVAKGDFGNLWDCIAGWWTGKKRRNFALICYECKEVVGWENALDPEGR